MLNAAFQRLEKVTRTKALEKVKKIRDNITPEERKALIKLKDFQNQGQITIKEVDKGGGIVVMNTEDYINEMESQLKSTFKNSDGTESPFYVPVKEKSLQNKKQEIQKLINIGLAKKYISESDAEIMEPNAQPGKMYGIPKLHKDIQEGKRIPNCRPIISNSGSNTEFISNFVDLH